MNHSFPAPDCALCVREYYKNGRSAVLARRQFCIIRGLTNSIDAPRISLIQKWVKEFEETGAITVNKNLGDQVHQEKANQSVLKNSGKKAKRKTRSTATKKSKEQKKEKAKSSEAVSSGSDDDSGSGSGSD